jgi:hypothetical protein
MIVPTAGSQPSPAPSHSAMDCPARSTERDFFSVPTPVRGLVIVLLENGAAMPRKSSARSSEIADLSLALTYHRVRHPLEDLHAGIIPATSVYDFRFRDAAISQQVLNLRDGQRPSQFLGLVLLSQKAAARL